MAGERPVQDRLDQVNSAIKKSERVRNFEGVPSLDRQLEGLDVLPVSDHAAKLLEIGERRRAIRTSIDGATQQLIGNKQKIEAELVKRETSVLPEQFDPQNPRGLTIQEAAVLVGLFTVRKPYLNSIGVTSLSEETSRAILDRVEVPIDREDAKKLREEVFMGLAEAVRIKTIDLVFDKTEDDDIRKLLTYFSVFQYDTSDEVSARFLEDMSFDFDVSRGQVTDVRFKASGIGGGAVRVESVVVDEYAGAEEVESNGETGKELDSGIIFDDDSMLGPGYDEAVAESFGLRLKEENKDEDLARPKTNTEPSEEIDEVETITDEEFEAWYREQEELEALVGGESDVYPDDLTVEEEETKEKSDSQFSLRAREISNRAASAALPTFFNIGAMASIHGDSIFRAVDQAKGRGLIARTRGHSNVRSGQQMFTKEDYAVILYLKEHNGLSKREARSIRNLTQMLVEAKENNDTTGRLPNGSE